MTNGWVSPHVALLIDGYNVLHQTGLLGRETGPKWLEQGRHRLIELLLKHLDADALANTTIVFDAHDAPRHLPAEQHPHGMRVLFARDHAAADDLIEELIQREPAPSKLVLVSSDRRLQVAAKRRRAIAMESMDWFERLKSHDAQAMGGKPAKPKSDKAIIEEAPGDETNWLEVFLGERVQREVKKKDKSTQETTKKATRIPAEKKPTSGPEKPKPKRRVQNPDSKRRAKRTLKREIENPFDPSDLEIE